jgi:hypothetical protein
MSFDVNARGSGRGPVSRFYKNDEYNTANAQRNTFGHK